MSRAKWATWCLSGRRLLVIWGSCVILLGILATSLQSQTSPTAGPGHFQAAINYPAGGFEPGQMALADFDGDGIPDLLVLDSANGPFAEVRFFHGNGDGTFGPGIPSSTPLMTPRALAVADMNRDGKLDAVIATDCIPNDCGQGAISVLLNNGDGTFSYSPDRTEFLGSVIQGNTLAIGDLDQDGNPDIVVGFVAGVAIVGIYYGAGDGTLSRTWVPVVANGPLFPAIADFDQGGVPDIVVVANAISSVPHSILIPIRSQGGKRNFEAGPALPLSLPDAASAVAVIDIDSDHKPDLAVSYTSSGPVVLQVLVNDGQGGFQNPITYQTALNHEQTNVAAIAVGDLDNDGKQDLIVSGSLAGFNGFEVFLNDGAGNLLAGEGYTAGGVMFAPVAIADLNGDLKSDVVLVSGEHQDEHANLPEGTFTVFIGHGDGTFRGAVYRSEPANAGRPSVAAGRFLGSPFLDLVFPDGSGFGLLPAPGSGSTVPNEYASQTQGTARTLAVGDFDGDGRPDVALFGDCNTTCSGSFMALFRNTGAGNFLEASPVDTLSQVAVTAVTGYFNPGPERDLAVLSASGPGNLPAISVLLGDGHGGFPQVVVTPLDPSASWIAAADLNGDGFTDLVVAQSVVIGGTSYAAVQVLLSDGSGSFTKNTDPYLAGGAPGYATATAAIGDVNHDGIPDIVVASFCVPGTVNTICSGGVIGVLFGRNDGTFLEGPTLNVPQGNFLGITLADVNGDGNLDVVASTLTGVAVAFGNGDGTFEKATIYAGLRVDLNTQLAVADLDGDGALDIVQPGDNRELAILFSSAQASTGIPTVTAVGGPQVFVGNPATVTVSVTAAQGTASGVVLLTVDNGSPLSQTLSNGIATFTIDGLSAGDHSLFASYAAQGLFAASSGNGTQHIIPLLVTVISATSSQNPATAGQLITFAATVSEAGGGAGVPTGTVTFNDGAAALSTAPLGLTGQASYSTFLAPGTHQIIAQYNGDGMHSTSTSSVLSQVVNAVTLPSGVTMTLYDRPNGTGNIVMTYTGPMLNPGTIPVSGIVLNPSVMQWSTPPVSAQDQPGSMNPCSAVVGNGGPNGEAAITCFSQAPGSQSNGVPLFSFCFQGVQWPMPLGTYNADAPNHSACGNYFVASSQVQGAGFSFAFLDSASVVVAQAPQTLVVTSLADDSSPGTLRYQIAAANPGDTITFSVSGTITLTQGQLHIGRKLTITGPGASNLTVSGNNSSIVFLVDTGADASISGLTIANGNSIQNGNGGGGIWNKGNLTVSSAFFTNNSTGCNCNSGGGIRNDGSLVVSGSTFSENSSAYGGGIGNWGSLSVTNSTFAKNGASFGGGIFSSSTATVTNSTFFNNGAGQSGPAMDGSGSATVKGSLFAANSFTDGLGNPGAPGSCTAIISAGYNLSDDNSCSAFLNNAGDRNNTPAGLDSNGLKDNGGTTITVALLSLSPAVDAIASNACTDASGNPLSADQRGIARPQGAACDIGAFERVPGIATTTSLASSGNPSILNSSVTFTATIAPTSGSAPPTGFVRFSDGSTVLETSPLVGNGQAAYSTSSLATGSHSISAAYTGDVAYDGSSSGPLVQVVNLLPTTTAISAPTIPYGNTATVTVSVSSGQTAVTGTVSLAVDNGAPTTKSLTNGAAVFSLSGLGGGTHGLSAAYAPQGNFAASSQTGTQQVDPATTSISISNIPTNATFGGSFVPAYAYTGDGAKSVTSSTPGTCTVSGTVVSFVGVGTCALTAHASATANYVAANGSSQPFAVAKATPTISITNLPIGAKVGGNFQPAYAYTGDGATSTTSSTLAVCTVSGLLVNFVSVGTCSLTAHATATTNSAAANGVTQSFAVAQATPTVSVNNIPSNAQYGGSFTPTYAYVGTGTTSTTSSTPTTCTVGMKNVVNFVKSGTCTLTAHASATTNYAAATGNPQSFTIAQAMTTISIKNIPNSAKRGGSFTPTYNYAGDGVASTSSSTPNICTVSGNTVNFVTSGTCTLIAKATAGTNYAATTGVPQSFTIK